MGSLWASGPQVNHQQTGAAVGPHPWGVGGLLQARLQAVGVGNPGWVLCSLSWSMPGTHIHVATHTHTHTDKCHMQTWAHPCLRAQPGLRPRVVVRHRVPPSPSSGSLAAPLKKP